VVEITALGDAVNTAARLAGQASVGEIIASEAIWSAAGLEGKVDGTIRRKLELKGKQEPIDVRVIQVAPG
jgi:class 3 adenylate cyclase